MDATAKVYAAPTDVFSLPQAFQDVAERLPLVLPNHRAFNSLSVCWNPSVLSVACGVPIPHSTAGDEAMRDTKLRPDMAVTNAGSK
jgi:hypothetical protein